MKKAILLILFCVTGLAYAQTAQKQKVYSIARVRHTPEWYNEQLALWETEVKNNPQNAEAWMNVYMATRMLKICHAGKTKKDMEAVVERVKTAIPNTFESHFIQYIDIGPQNNEKISEELVKAAEINPNRPELFEAFVLFYELSRNKPKLKEYCEKWYASNDISPGMLSWNYNMLMSCEDKAVLITDGDNDTFPAWVLQHVLGIKPGVMVLNSSLILYSKPYRKLVFKELGISEMQHKDYGSDSLAIQAICAHIQKHTTLPFYYAMSVMSSHYSNVKDSVYTVGLTLKFSPERFDNMALLRRNVEKKFLKDYIKIDMMNDVSQSVVQDLNCAYLTPFLTLYCHYKDSGETVLMEEIVTYINRIAKQSGITAEVEKIMKEGKM